MNATTALVLAEVRRVTVAWTPLGEGDQPKLRMFHWPLGKAAGSIPGMLVTFRRSMERRVSVWRLTQSVLKKWLLVGSAITSRVVCVWSAGAGVARKSSVVETP